MAARRLKFKPKPSVGTTARRVKDNEDVSGLIKIEQPAIYEKPSSSDGGSVKSKFNKEISELENNSNLTVKKLKFDASVNKLKTIDDLDETKVLPPSVYSSELGNVYKDSESILPIKESSSYEGKIESTHFPSFGHDYISTYSKSCDNSLLPSTADLTQNNDGVSTISNKMVKHMIPVNTKGSYKSSNILDQSISHVNSIKKNNSLTKQMSSNVCNKDFTSVKHTVQSDSMKKSRFVRSHFKPVINSARKKSEVIENINTSSNVHDSTDSGVNINSCDSNNEGKVCKTNPTNIISPKICVTNKDVQTINIENEQSAIQTDSVVNSLLKSSTPENLNDKIMSGIISSSVEDPNNSCEDISKSNKKKLELFIINSNSNKNTPSPKNIPLSPLRSPSTILMPKPGPSFTDAPSRRIILHGSDSEVGTKKKTCSGKEKKKTVKDANTLKTRSPNQNTKERKKQAKHTVSQYVEDALEEQSVDDVEPAVAVPVPVPRLMVGPDGQVMLDPQSLVIETTGLNKSRQELESSEVVKEDGMTHSNTYSKNKNNRCRWAPEETIQFYQVLSTIGTDFSLMTHFFPKRTRRDLKLKFKREEKTNLHLIDKAIRTRSEFDVETLKSEIQRKNEEIQMKKKEEALAKEVAKRQSALKKAESTNKKSNKRINRNIKMKNCALKEFSEEEFQALYNRKPIMPWKGKCTKKGNGPEANFEDETDDKKLRIVDSSEEEVPFVSLLSNITYPRYKCRQEEYKEYKKMNDALKNKLEQTLTKNTNKSHSNQLNDDSELEEDVHSPNGLGPFMLFGSPLKEPMEEESEPLLEDNQCNIEMVKIPNIEETVMADNIELVSENTELGSFG